MKKITKWKIAMIITAAVITILVAHYAYRSDLIGTYDLLGQPIYLASDADEAEAMLFSQPGEQLGKFVDINGLVKKTLASEDEDGWHVVIVDTDLGSEAGRIVLKYKGGNEFEPCDYIRITGAVAGTYVEATNEFDAPMDADTVWIPTLLSNQVERANELLGFMTLFSGQEILEQLVEEK